MLLLIFGLAIFLGMHSIYMFAEGWRQSQIQRLGASAWKGLFALVSLVGLILIIIGFGAAQTTLVLIYVPPAWLRHLNIVLTLIAFVLVTAAYVPRNHFKERIGHPMLAGVAIWAFGHLLAIGMLRDVLLFGAFLAWAIVDFVVSRRRDRRAGTVYPRGEQQGDVVTVAVGMAVWAAFAFWLHEWLIGVNPLA